jgi:hypothetical protein
MCVCMEYIIFFLGLVSSFKTENFVPLFFSIISIVSFSRACEAV